MRIGIRRGQVQWREGSNEI
jgi:SRSO17 transposase